MDKWILYLYRQCIGTKINTMTKRKEIKKELSADVKKALRSDIELAAKIINALGRKPGLYAYLALIERNSKMLLKNEILSIIADHLKLSTDELFSNNNKKKSNNQ